MNTTVKQAEVEVHNTFSVIQHILCHYLLPKSRNDFCNKCKATLPFSERLTIKKLLAWYKTSVLLCPVLESYTMSLRKVTPNLDFKSQRHKPYSPKIMKYWKD